MSPVDQNLVAHLLAPARQGTELVKSLTILGCISPLILILYASVFPQIFDDECIVPAYLWTIFTSVTEYLVLWLAWRHGLVSHSSTLIIWAGMMCVIGTAISVFSRSCMIISYQRAFIILGVWAPLLTNYGPVLLVMTRMAYNAHAPRPLLLPPQQPQPQQPQYADQPPTVVQRGETGSDEVPGAVEVSVPSCT